MSIWMWSMKLRFQIGSNSPLANRKARMFCGASLPRKWSMREIWGSSKTRCTPRLRATRVAVGGEVNVWRLVDALVLVLVERHRGGEVGAERFLHDDPRPLDQVGLVE